MKYIITEKQYNLLKEDIEWSNNELKRRITFIEETIEEQIEEILNDDISFADEFEFADNVIMNVVDKMMALPEYENLDYDDLTNWIKDKFGEDILSRY